MVQHTLQRTGTLRGTGLHTGKEASITFHPAEPGTGIVWRRTGGQEAPPEGRGRVGPPGPGAGGAVMAPSGASGLLGWVTRTERATSLGPPPGGVQTVEHVMAALAGVGVDNAVIEVDGPETPFLDGSAAPFARFLEEELGLEPQGVPRAWRRLERPVLQATGGAVLVAWPDDGFSLTYTFVSDHPALGCQFAEFRMDPGEGRESYARRFRAEIAPARTLGWLHEVEALHARGLALGASMDSAVVVDRERLLTPLRMPNEVARHKLLDLLGDLYLLGPVLARVVALRSGHRHHVALAREMAAHLSPPGNV